MTWNAGVRAVLEADQAKLAAPGSGQRPVWTYWMQSPWFLNPLSSRRNTDCQPSDLHESMVLATANSVAPTITGS